VSELFSNYFKVNGRIMKRLVLLIHASLDGFVAGPNREMNWIKVDEELFEFVGKIIEQADTALYGRVTYQMMESYWPTAGDKPNASKHDIQHSHWYRNVFKVIISNSMKGNDIPRVKIINSDIPKQIEHLKQEPGKNILMLGSPTASHLLMQNNLIDEYWIFVNPILIGGGIPLFKNINDKVNLSLKKTNVFLSGVIGLHYEKK
jgi:dihydrofolate reductase